MRHNAWHTKFASLSATFGLSLDSSGDLARRNAGQHFSIALIFAVSLVMAAPIGRAHAQEVRAFSPEMVRVEHVQIGTSRFDLIQNEEVNGDWYFEGSVSDGVYRLVDGTTLYPDIRESGVWTMSAQTFAPLTLSLDGDFSRNVLDADLAWRDGRVGGEYRMRRPNESVRRTVAFSQDVRPGAIFRAAAFALAPGLDFTAGPISLVWFSDLSGQYEDVRLVPEGAAEVSTPAGVFATEVIGVRGGSVENLLYITRDTHPRLVRVDVVGQNMRMVYRGSQ